MKPIHFKKLLDKPEVRTYTQSFDSAWTVVSGTVAAFDVDDVDVTETVIQATEATASAVNFQTQPAIPAGIYTIIVTATMDNGDIVDVPGILTITAIPVSVTPDTGGGLEFNIADNSQYLPLVF